MDDAGQLHAVSDHLPTLKWQGGGVFVCYGWFAWRHSSEQDQKKVRLNLFYGASLRFYNLIVPDGSSRLSMMRR